MAAVETVAMGREKRTTAGNRMRELLEKAHQEDEDELFKEVEDDEEFEAPLDQRDVYLEDFADTDDEVEIDEEELERQVRREERRKAKGKSKVSFNPLLPRSKARPSDPSTSAAAAESLALFDPSLDIASMAPSTLVLALRKHRREAKRQQRSEVRRSNLRASTLRTEEEILAKEQEEKAQPHRKGRKAQHEGGEVRGVRNYTQDELIAAALEEEERNKDELQKWLRREEEKRELRRIGRKRVVGPRWTWISRTVGKVVEVIPDPPPEPPTDGPIEAPESQSEQATAAPPPPSPPAASFESAAAPGAPATAATTSDSSGAGPSAAGPSGPPAPPVELPAPVTTSAPSQPPDAPTVEDESLAAAYMRNYLILSQIPGGLPAELAIVLGDHVEWDQVQYIPARNRPINRRPLLCPLTGLPAKYRHPETMTPYANIEAFREINAILDERYVWGGMGWMGGEDDVKADGVEEDVPGWQEAIQGGWLAGKRIEEEEEEEVVEEIEEEVVEEVEEVVEERPKGKKRKNEAVEGDSRGKKKRKGEVEIEELMPPNKPKAKGKAKGKGKTKK